MENLTVLIEEVVFVLLPILELICFIFVPYNPIVFTYVMVINGILMTGLGLHIISQEENTK